MAILNDNQMGAVSGGAAHANGQYWSDGGATYYRIAPNDSSAPPPMPSSSSTPASSRTSTSSAPAT